MENINWQKIRKEFPLLNNYTYFNTARFGAIPSAGTSLQKKYLESLNNHGSWNFEEWSLKYEEARSLSAKLLGASLDNIFFMSNVSTGINLASLYLKADEVILLDNDFPSVTLPWESHLFKTASIDYTRPDLYEALASQLKKGNKLLCLSWIQSEDGFEVDLKQIYKLCKEYNTTLILDGTQGLGSVPFQIDPDVSMLFLAATWKWLMAGYGSTIGYLSEDLLPIFKSFQGWNSINNAIGSPKIGAASLEVGNAMFFNILALYEGLKIVHSLGVDNICSRNLETRNHLTTELRNIEIPFKYYTESRSSFVQIENKNETYEKLKEANIQTSNQGSFIRLSPNFYNNEEDIEKVISSLKF